MIWNLVLYKKIFCNPCFNSLIDKIKRLLDRGNFTFGIFIDHQEAFEGVERDIFNTKSNQYGIIRVANNSFSSYLQNGS